MAPTGQDTNPGTQARPFASLTRAQEAARTLSGREPVTVSLRAGTYYLPETLVFTAADSGTAEAPVVYQAYAGEAAVLSGGLRLTLRWQPHTNDIWKARVDAPAIDAARWAMGDRLWATSFDQLFVNGRRQPMARYPNLDPAIRIYHGYAADAFSPQRAARWADPTGGFIHAMHAAHWGGYHYRITGKKPDHTVTYEGGWQNNRQMGMHREHRFVEHIFEELDAPGEWFLDVKTGTLYYQPPPGLDLATATVEVVRLRHLVEFRGGPLTPALSTDGGEGARRMGEAGSGKAVRFVTLRGLILRHAARTFMENREPLLRSDWTTYRGGAVLFEGTEDCALEDCVLDQLGGNAVFVNHYNRRVTIRGCHITQAGANGVAFVGDPKAVRHPLFEYGQRQSYEAIDQTPGPKSPNYPADCLVEDCLIELSGRVEKQTAPVQIAMAQNITVRHCSIYDVPRAGINIGDGCWGGHVIEGCDVFETVKETGDHGSFNSWGRDRFWGLKNAPESELPRLALLDAVKPIVLRNNRWRCDHGWDVDLDDGSSHYEIYENVFLRGGLKLREGFHRRVWNNIAVNDSLHPHVWYPNSGDIVTNNIWMGAYRPAAMSGSLTRWGQEVDRNLFTTSEADRVKFAGKGCDAHSLVGDARFVDPARGDFRVQDGSPALQLGFRNFPMDQFGVRKAALKKIARTPELPKVRAGVESRVPGAAGTPGPVTPLTPALSPLRGEGVPAAGAARWLGATVRELTGQEFSAYGVSKESGGVLMESVPAGSAAARRGFQTGDLIQSVNGRPVKGVSDLRRLLTEAGAQPLDIGIVRGQRPQTVRIAGGSSVEEGTAPPESGRQSGQGRGVPSPATDTHGAFGAADAAEPPRGRRRLERQVHDPSAIVKCRDEYWLFATGPGIVSRRSKDLVRWEPGPRVFAQAPSWTTQVVPDHRGYFWAPDIISFKGRYLLYYSVSSWGKNRSAIGLARASTLDPADPQFGWTDEGIVVESWATNDFNAIDPSVSLDAQGRLWLAFGSFWTGIKLIELHPGTGRRLASGSPVHSVARQAQIEAACLVRHGDAHYLFVNWGACCRGTNSTYEIRVGRSRYVAGPYLDRAGRDLAGGGGSAFLSTAGRFIGPGHAGVFREGRDTWLSYHFYDRDRDGLATLALRRLAWDAEGWPVAGALVSPAPD